MNVVKSRNPGRIRNLTLRPLSELQYPDTIISSKNGKSITSDLMHTMGPKTNTFYNTKISLKDKVDIQSAMRTFNFND